MGFMIHKIKEMREYLSKFTKEETDFIAHILSWDAETIIAFKLIKKEFDQL